MGRGGGSGRHGRSFIYGIVFALGNETVLVLSNATCLVMIGTSSNEDMKIGVETDLGLPGISGGRSSSSNSTKIPTGSGSVAAIATGSLSVVGISFGIGSVVGSGSVTAVRVGCVSAVAIRDVINWG